MMRRAAGYTAQLSVPRVTTILSCLQPRGTFSRIPASCAREETPESRGMPCLFLNTERGFGGKPPQKSGFRRHLAGSKMPKEGSKMPKETFHGDLPLESGLAA